MARLGAAGSKPRRASDAETGEASSSAGGRRRRGTEGLTSELRGVGGVYWCRWDRGRGGGAVGTKGLGCHCGGYWRRYEYRWGVLGGLGAQVSSLSHDDVCR
jgi:hypothetical protein